MTSYIFIRYYIHYTYLPNIMYIYDVCKINGLSSANVHRDKFCYFILQYLLNHYGHLPYHLYQMDKQISTSARTGYEALHTRLMVKICL